MYQHVRTSHVIYVFSPPVTVTGYHRKIKDLRKAPETTVTETGYRQQKSRPKAAW
jgi:hypothetical protein